MTKTPPFADMSPVLRAQRWVLSVMALFPERRDADGAFSSIVTRPFGSALALSLLAAEGIRDADDARRELVLLQSAARHTEPVYNLARAALIAARAHTAYLLPLSEAWSTAVECARALQQHCRGWFSMAEACLTGLTTHEGEAAGRVAREAFYALHARPDSPWNVLPWKTELPDELPPPEVVTDRVPVADSESLRVALASAFPGQTIKLAPNRYLGPFQVTAPGLTLEGGPEVFLLNPDDCDTSVALLSITAPTALSGLTLRPGPGATAVSANADFVGLDGCFFESGRCGLHFSGNWLQLRDCSFEDQSIALALDAGEVSLSAPAFHRAGLALQLGPELDSLRVEAGSTLACTTTLAAAARSVAPHTPAPDIRLRGFRSDSGILDFRDDGRVQLHDCRLAGGIHVGGGELVAETCQFSETSRVEYAIAHFRDCHFLGSTRGNLVLGEGQFTTCLGGQMAGADDPDAANLTVLGGRVRLEGMALGPSAGHNLAIDPARSLSRSVRASTAAAPPRANAHVELSDVAVSSAGREAILLRGEEGSSVVLTARGLRIRGTASSAIRATGARLELVGLDLADIGESALIATGTDLSALGFGLRGARSGLFVEAGSRVLIRDLVPSGVEGPLVTVRAARCAVTGSDLPLTGDISHGAIFAASQATLNAQALTLDDATAELDRCRLAVASVKLHGSRLSLRKCELSEDALSSDPTSAIAIDASPPHSTAISPLLVAPRPDAFVAWGSPGDVGALVSVARALARRLGYLERLGLRETPQGLRVDGPLPVVARFAPALMAAMTSPAGLGLLLAEALEVPPLV